MPYILAGLLLIAIGFVIDRSVFLGDFSLFAIICDGLGIFAVVLGATRMYRARQEAKPPA